MEWCPNGETFLTATTAPRLRIGNGFKVWHYSGALLHETNWAAGQELFEVVWQKYNEGVYKEKPISNEKVQGIQPSQPQASKAVYVPPGARAGRALLTPKSSQAATEKSSIPGLPIGYKVSQNQLKKNRNARRKNNENVSTLSTKSANGTTTEDAVIISNITAPGGNPTTNKRFSHAERTPRQNQNHVNNNSNKGNNSNKNHNNNNNNEENSTPVHSESGNNQVRKRNATPRWSRSKQDSVVTTGDPEKDKRIKIIHKKLQDISKLKSRKNNGELLEANQLSKIHLEADLTKELNSLKIVA